LRYFEKLIPLLRHDKEEAALRRTWRMLKNHLAANVLLASAQKVLGGVNYMEKPRYFSMKVGKGDGFELISSEILPRVDAEWRSIANREIVALEIPPA
jgi:hypothetical protein